MYIRTYMCILHVYELWPLLFQQKGDKMKYSDFFDPPDDQEMIQSTVEEDDSDHKAANDDMG